MERTLQGRYADTVKYNAKRKLRGNFTKPQRALFFHLRRR
jgi:hypothetical protein